MSAATAKHQEPSMEEILASIRRIIADDQDEAPRDPPSEPVRLPTSLSDFASEPSAPPRIMPTERSRPSRAKERPSLEVNVPDLSFNEAEDEQPAAPEPAAIAEAPAAAEPAKAEAPRRPSLEALISSDATETVGRAFNMLSQTVLSENARTLEDLVGEMLRPMLKVWLDDNLPPLVERLVRSEIERVARGRP